MTYTSVGKSISRLDGAAKVTGEAKFTGDLYFPNMLYAQVLYSTVAHAEIIKVDSSKALKLPGVKAIVTHKDVPKNKFTSTGHPYPDDTPLDSLILNEKVRYIGDPVAAIVAVSEDIAKEAVSLINVEYKELEPILSVEEAIMKNVEVHAQTDNIAGENSYEYGNVNLAFDKSDYVFEDEFKTQIVQHCPIETHVSIAIPESNERLTVYSSTQSPFTVRRLLSKALGMPIGKVRIVKPHVGGGFGSKQDMCQEALNAFLAIKTGKPVKLEITREDDMVSTRTRHSMSFKIKTGLNKEGKILARQLQATSNTGAYSAHGHSVLLNICSVFPVLYPASNLKFEGTTYYTNLPIASAMRGYGIPQLTYAVESHIDNIAKEMRLDPIVFRLKNLCGLGYTNPVSHVKIESFGLKDIIELGKVKSGWDKKRTDYLSTNSYGNIKKGIGMACFAYASCTAPELSETSGAVVKMNEDGSAVLSIGAADIGQGTDTIFAQIVAEELGISIDTIKVIAVDTDTCPFDLGAYASRQTYVGASAVKKAASHCRKQVLEIASKKYGFSTQKLKILKGYIYTDSNKQLGPISEVAMEAFYKIGDSKTIYGEASNSPKTNAYSFGANFVEVEVDTTTGTVKINKIWAIHDSGKIINPLLAEGQVYGGVLMGVAYGLYEEMQVNTMTGKVYNNNLLDYKIPTIKDVPPIEVIFVETEEPSSAYGEKSLGEPPVLPTAPAIRNAILNATGLELNQLPMTPQRVLQGIKHQTSIEFKVVK
ncbi:MAG: hypothetical protein APF76_14115 [Desulfitibacter sp. BRH_c19]|nr:MAG: hypothetical protein APF76_14115 [Desulfitibacter sp. BRH_c19]